jgi:hypothetical protein
MSIVCVKRVVLHSDVKIFLLTHVSVQMRLKNWFVLVKFLHFFFDRG